MSQIAAEIALTERDELDEIYLEYQTNRDLLIRELPQLGLPLASPMDGAFYAYVDVTKYSQNSQKFAQQMLDEINIASVPGRDFDPVDVHRYLRFSYAGNPKDIEEAVSRLSSWLPSLKL